MFVVPSLILVAALAVGLAAADRIIGWGGWGRSKPVIAVSVLLAGVGFLAHFPPVACVTLALAFLIWRTPKWEVLGGSIDPAPNKAFGTFLRHLLAMAFVVPAYFAAVNPVVMAGAMGAFAISATALGVYHWYSVTKKNIDNNTMIETVRGGLLGLLLGLALFVVKLK